MRKAPPRGCGLVAGRSTGGRFVATFTASPSNERLSFSLDPQFSASPRFDSYLAAGVAAASPATTDRKILIDDIALTVR